MRLTCTSVGERKMLICCQLPPGHDAPVAAPATITRPSAGDSTASASLVIVRWGSRKKNRKKQVRTRKIAAPPAPMNHSARIARINEPPMNGQPAGSMRIIPSYRKMAGEVPGRSSVLWGGRHEPAEFIEPSGGAAVLARVLADDGLHLILE